MHTYIYISIIYIYIHISIYIYVYIYMGHDLLYYGNKYPLVNATALLIIPPPFAKMQAW